MSGEKLSFNSEDFEKANLEKHKDKLAAFYLTNGEQRYIYDHSPEFSNVEILPEHRNAVVENMKNGVDYRGIEKKLLLNIAGPEYTRGADGSFIYRPDIVFNSLSDDKHQKRILTYMTGEELDHYNEVNGDNVDSFLQIYPTPMDFEDNSEKFLKIIEEANGKEKGLEYREAMEEFKANVYGKKYEYYKAMQDFHKEADERKRQDFGVIDAGELANPTYDTESRFKRYSEISRNEAVNILRYTRLEGDPVSFSQNPAELVSINKLLDNELEPRYNFQIEDVSFNTSRAFKLGSRDAVICYVNTPDGRVSARSYYRSNSQGVWRYLPDYKVNESGGVEWYGKGSNEQQLTLPMEVQGVLNDIAKQSFDEESNSNKSATVGMLECFFGTAKKMTDTWGYLAKRWNGESGDALDTEVDNRPAIRLLGSLANVPPERMYVSDRTLPNFDNQTGEFDMKSEIYGDAKVRLFKSNDGDLTWSFVENPEGKVCIGGVETKSKITSTGLRQEWVDAGDFAVPLYEYDKQSFGLGDYDDKKGMYVGMWKKCLSRMPIIQAYKYRNTGQNKQTA